MKRLLALIALCATTLTGCLGAGPLIPKLPEEVVAVMLTFETPEGREGETSRCLHVSPGKVIVVVNTKEFDSLNNEAAVLLELLRASKSCSADSLRYLQDLRDSEPM